MGQSWWLISVVATLKENSVLNSKLLSNSIYVHVLVTFVITFSRSGTYQYCYCMLDCRWPYSPEKLFFDPFPGKRKGIRVYRGCCKCWMCVGGFSCCVLFSRLCSQFWCLSVMRNLTRSISLLHAVLFLFCGFLLLCEAEFCLCWILFVCAGCR